ncbi:MAG TPA: MBL fold metallo-hydrolase [Steroidobacteraceae bacterium]|nr:MBL fold metallo-hydrolase [Steroidobacteraceae bacterium]
MAIEHVKKWRIGDVEVARFVEVNAFEDDMQMLLKEGTTEFVQSFPWLVPHFATRAGRMLISFQCFALRSRGRNVMIDTCIGADRKREFDVFCNLKSSFLEDLTAAEFPPDSIATVLCTHLHFDHVGWNTHLVDGRWVPTFPKARYLFGEREWEHWQHLRRTGGYHDLNHLADAVDPILEAGLAEFVGPQHRITDEVWLEPTPGHTPGHVSVHISSLGEEAVITGDLMHHPIQLAVPELQGNFDMDKAQGARTRRAFVERYQDRKALIIGSHFCDPTSGWIVRDGAAWKLALE